ncbi:phosphotransferase [Pseudoclavibacter sp. 8L]|uniref:phosphotransferase n=1 Tax=Pseudoclavibacter sp. 8L TaxID=2653162 RepID=UPI0012F46238|nr:phosphotransferase [Pseudoclavibacter sp. 8L]VXC01723.1 hypothetical protein PSCLAVI8L_270026 [Pseudoclavibacter sp. 8L]
MKTSDFATVGDRSAPVPPNLELRQVARIAASTHGLDVRSASALGGEWASNARLDLSDGTSRMFKAVGARDAHHAEQLRARLEWRSSLARTAATVGIPAALPEPCLVGGDVAILEHDDSTLLVVVSEWMPGIPFAEYRPTPLNAASTRREIGRAAAAMVEALSGHPGSQEDIQHEWAFETMPETIRGALGTDAARTRISETDRSCVERLISRFEGLHEVVLAAPHGLTHHDFNDFNLLVDPETGHLTGVVDFDDARLAPLMSEVSIAAAYAMLGADADPLAALSDVVDGASEVRAWSDDEVSAIFAGAAVRLCLNAVVWTVRSEGHNASYGAARMARTWPIVRLLAATGVEDGTEVVHGTSAGRAE